MYYFFLLTCLPGPLMLEVRGSKAGGRCRTPKVYLLRRFMSPLGFHAQACAIRCKFVQSWAAALTYLSRIVHDVWCQ